MLQDHPPLSAPPIYPPQGGRSTAAVGFTSGSVVALRFTSGSAATLGFTSRRPLTLGTMSGLPLTLTLSPQAGRGDEATALAADLLLPACGEKVAGRPDEGQPADVEVRIAVTRRRRRKRPSHPSRTVWRGHPPLSATPTSPPQGGRSPAVLGANFDMTIGVLVIGTRGPFAETHKRDSRQQVIAGAPAARRSPPLRGRCPAGQRGVTPHGDLPHA